MAWFERSMAKGADVLSALMLLIVVLLAGGQGALTSQAPSGPVPHNTGLADKGTGGHRSAPVVLKQNLLALEARDARTASGDDGYPEPLLASQRFDLSPEAGQLILVSQRETGLLGIVASYFNARAPPEPA